MIGAREVVSKHPTRRTKSLFTTRLKTKSNPRARNAKMCTYAAFLFPKKGLDPVEDDEEWASKISNFLCVSDCLHFMGEVNFGDMLYLKYCAIIIQ